MEYIRTSEEEKKLIENIERLDKMSHKELMFACERYIRMNYEQLLKIEELKQKEKFFRDKFYALNSQSIQRLPIRKGVSL